MTDRIDMTADIHIEVSHVIYTDIFSFALLRPSLAIHQQTVTLTFLPLGDPPCELKHFCKKNRCPFSFPKQRLATFFPKQSRRATAAAVLAVPVCRRYPALHLSALSYALHLTRPRTLRPWRGAHSRPATQPRRGASVRCPEPSNRGAGLRSTPARGRERSCRAQANSETPAMPS
jgi:hypothetical protein